MHHEEPYEVGIDLGSNVITFTTPRKSKASGIVSKNPMTKIGSIVASGAQLDSAGKSSSKDQAPPIVSSPETIMSVLDPAGKGSSVDVVESADENKSDSVAKNVPGSPSSPNIVNLKNVGNIDEWVKEGKGKHVVITRDLKGSLKYPGSIWGNPHRLSDHGYNRKKVLDLYRSHILSNDELKEKVGELKGKILGCCCAPELCHAEVLHHLAGNCPQYEGEDTSEQEAIILADNVDNDKSYGVGIVPEVKSNEETVPCTVDVCTQNITNLCDVADSPIAANLGTPDGPEKFDNNNVVEVPSGLQIPLETSIPIVTHETPIKVVPRNMCNPFDINIPIQDVMNSLEHVDGEGTTSLSEATPDPARSSARSMRPLRNSIAAHSDDETNELEHEVVPDTNAKEILVAKTRSAKEDREENLLHERSVDITRGKGLQLKEEDVSHGVYKKKSGFRTHRPIEWAVALEDLLTDYRWDYVMHDNMYTQCLIKVTNAGGMINIDIKLTTGIIFVYGSSYEEWLNAFFESWRSLVVDGVRKTADITSDIPQPPISTEADIRADVERLWTEHTSLKNAVVTLDSTVNNLSADIQSMVSAFNDLKSSQEESSRRTLSKNDEKLKVFLETASDECVGKISKCRLEMKNELEKHKLLIIKQESRFQSVTDQLKNQIQNKTHPEDSSVKWIHLDNIRKSCSASNENLDTQVQIIREQLEVVSAKVETPTPCPYASNAIIMEY